MQHQQQYADRRQTKLINNKHRTKYDDFYRKLERLRLSSSTSSSSSKQYPQRTATELLNESKSLFVKSQEVLHNQQTLTTDNQRFISPTVFRTAKPRRSPYHDSDYEQNQHRLDLSLRSSTSPTTNSSDCLFESVSVISLSDQTTLDSTNSPSHRKQTIVPSSITIIERNARILKWLFQLHKINDSSSFSCS